jgi:peptidyl-dipeptidase A
MNRLKQGLASAVAMGVLAAAGCASALADPTVSPQAAAPAQVAASSGPSADEAQAFLAKVDRETKAFSEEAARIYWLQQTNISDDTNWLSSRYQARGTQIAVGNALQAASYNGLALPPEARRQLDLLKQSITLPAPTTRGAAAELSEISTRLGSTYSTGRIEFEGQTIPQNETELLMRSLRDPDKLQEVWTKWHEVPKAMKADYVRLVEIANAGAAELGFADVGAMWRSGYDMDPDDFAIEVDRLWSQVEPLYVELHCYVRADLNAKYGDAVQPATGPIRADLLGNMWAQQWGALYDMVEPEGSKNPVDLDKQLIAAGYDPLKMVKTGEAFFSSLGFAPLPETFWTRSQITKPRDRDVVCHASAWNIDGEDDIRIKMCTQVNAEDFITIHHELGHNYYQRAYKDLPAVFRTGANDGFHEAIGDMIALSITPEYLKQIGLIDTIPGTEADIGLLMQTALDKIAFLPFGLLVDKWRWEVFSGELTPETYNQGWWDLRLQYQGIVPPNVRPADAFDPGGKYHIPGNVPYMRYFLSHILQFQFHKAACDQAGWTGPLHRCSIYGNAEVGKRFNAMLEMGASKPWPDALEAFTGTRQMDGSAVLEYYAPLYAWLKKENEGRTCGW